MSLLKNHFDIIGISKHKINKGSKNSAFNLCGYMLRFNETKISDKGTGFFVFNSLTYKLRTDLFVNEHVRLDSTVTELIFLSKILLSVVL